MNVFKVTKATVAALSFTAMTQFGALALAEGPSGTGGGDQFVRDFVAVATQEVYPYLKNFGKSLDRRVEAEDFLLAVNPKDIESQNRVYEKCDPRSHEEKEREVEVCYNADLDRYYISRTLYPLKQMNMASKRALVAHEIFRKMGIEGDGYEVSKQMPILDGKSKSNSSKNVAVNLFGNSSEAGRDSDEVLKQLANEMTTSLLEIQKLIDADDAAAALTLSKRTLDTVRVKIGIDPKAKLKENFLVPAVFVESAKQFDDLSSDQKELVVSTIASLRGGLYLDILNLAKRTTLLYITALHDLVKRDGGLLNDDQNKIINDLVTASVWPIAIKDRKGHNIAVFDDEIANDDHTYMFNREMKSYVVNNKDLKISEREFENRKSKAKETAQKELFDIWLKENPDNLSKARVCQKYTKEEAPKRLCAGQDNCTFGSATVSIECGGKIYKYNF